MLRSVFDLSPRERECLLWAARGKTYFETALILGLALGTVKTHLDAARHKLGGVTLAQATANAVALGVITAADLWLQRTGHDRTDAELHPGGTDRQPDGGAAGHQQRAGSP